MPTERQKNAFNNVVGNGGNVSQAMRDAKYSENTINTPQKLTDSRGFQILLEEAGLTDNFLNRCLYEDIKEKKANRKAELELAFKLKGRMVDKSEVEVKLPKPIMDLTNGLQENNSNKEDNIIEEED